MDLFFDSEPLGEIDDVTMDDFWLVGRFHPLPSAARFAELFAFLCKEDKSPNDEPPVPDDIIFGTHWSIIDDDGVRKVIICPAVHDDGVISWQWTK
jgi:hypothetical protein